MMSSSMGKASRFGTLRLAFVGVAAGAWLLWRAARTAHVWKCFGRKTGAIAALQERERDIALAPRTSWMDEAR